MHPYVALSDDPAVDHCHHKWHPPRLQVIVVVQDIPGDVVAVVHSRSSIAADVGISRGRVQVVRVAGVAAGGYMWQCSSYQSREGPGSVGCSGSVW